MQQGFFTFFLGNRLANHLKGHYPNAAWEVLVGRVLSDGAWLIATFLAFREAWRTAGSHNHGIHAAFGGTPSCHIFNRFGQTRHQNR
jgi:hypothetical protein